jgi:transposase InsO family protein
VRATAVQEALRALFSCWGLPERIRVDNGAPWANWSDLPPALVLWWLGLGIEPVWNHPHRPQENAFVERCNGLLSAWGEPQACPDYSAWEARLRWLEHTQRERYPAVGGRTRVEAYPALRQNPREYSRERAYVL